MRVIAIDWSGAARGARKRICLAEVVQGELCRIEGGRDRVEIARHLQEEAERDPQIVIGLDFAFSLPEWFLRSRSLRTVQELWALAARKGEEWLNAVQPPFWGRSGRKPDLPEEFRKTEKLVPRVGSIGPKSVFQIGGAGAVGTGSIRGMRLLHGLHGAGFCIWPFDEPGLPFVVEIYPRVLTGEVNKSSRAALEDYLARRYPAVDARLRGLAASSEDAFDAAVSALVMSEHLNEIVSLEPASDPQIQLEGLIWHPSAAAIASARPSPEPVRLSQPLGTMVKGRLSERPGYPPDPAKTSIRRVGFIGLGIMGRPMASNLLAAGFQLTVHSRRRSPVEELVAKGAAAGGSAAGVARRSEVVITMLPDTPDVEAVLFGPEGVAEVIAPGAVVIDMSTISPAATEDFARRLDERGAEMLDAPVSGGDKGAIEGTLVIMVGGKPEVFERCRPVLDALGRNVVHMGPHGHGQRTKLVNQVVGGLTLLALAEGLAFAREMGLDLGKVLEVVARGAAASWMLSNLGPKVVAGDYAPGFMIKLQRKDLDLAREAMRGLGVEFPGTTLTRDLFSRAEAEGLGEQGTQGLVNLYAERRQLDPARERPS